MTPSKLTCVCRWFMFPNTMPSPPEFPTPTKRPVPPQLTPWTTERAREANRRKAELRQQRLLAAPAPLRPPTDTTERLTDERLNLLDEQSKLTRKALNEPDLAPKDRAQLVRALCGLLDQQRIARGEPLPGSRKPAPETTQRRVAPHQAAPVPVPAPVPEPAEIAP